MSDTEPGSDTGPLDPEQLSKNELKAIFAIEDRLQEASKAEQTSLGKEAAYLPMAEHRHPRVLLLDGGRGTGKTSLMLTMLKRWHAALNRDPEASKTLEEAYQRRAKDLDIDTRCLPRNLRVLGVLDFDPLPPGVPLVAGIVQAWKPIAEAYERELTESRCNPEEPSSPMERWHSLFRMAAVGWSTAQQSKGLIEQVLDREDQVQDWQRLNRQWQDFVWEMIDVGKRIPTHGLGKDVVFVIMIDDVDLQVGRIRELLPTLRLLYHPRVFFIVAADRDHMLHMLRLDFYGQQLELARRRDSSSAQNLDINDLAWAEDLALSSFEKVFPTANCMKLDWLSLEEALAYPNQPLSSPQPDSSPSFLSHLENLGWESSGKKPYEQVRSLAKAAMEGNIELPGVITYRAAEQLRHLTNRVGSDNLRAAEILARLLSSTRAAQRARVKSEGKRIEVEATGELAALYRPGLSIPGLDFDVVFGGRVDFMFRPTGDTTSIRMSTAPESRFNFVGALIAKSLQDDRFPVEATGLRWETYLSHAWTEWHTPQLALAWTQHKHPTPVELFRNTEEWHKFVEEGPRNNYTIERFAFGWIYYQRRWNDASFDSTALDPAQPEAIDTKLWRQLLDFSKTDRAERDRWLKETLPSLARPELGFPPNVQQLLLQDVVADEKTKRWLKSNRREMITNAVFASSFQNGIIISKGPDDAWIESVIARIDENYKDVHDDLNLWSEIEQADSRPSADLA